MITQLDPWSTDGAQKENKPVKENTSNTVPRPTNRHGPKTEQTHELTLCNETQPYASYSK